MLTLFWYFYLSTVALTSRIRATSASEESIRCFRERRPSIYVFWQRDILFLLYFLGRRRMPILLTPHGKTDRIARLASWLGLKVAKGSLEGGGRHALVTMLDTLKTGVPVALPADGARGPERQCKASCFILAQETGAPIIPVSWRALLRLKIPRRQGAYYVPLPFNSIEVRFGAPLRVNRHFKFEELDGVRGQLTVQLDRLI